MAAPITGRGSNGVSSENFNASAIVFRARAPLLVTISNVLCMS